MKIWFDMDGTITDLYGVKDWLPQLIAEDPSPYEVAKPMVNLALLARLLNRAQAEGHEIGVITWTSKGGSYSYHQAVALAKRAWLKAHLPSVQWDTIEIMEYGTPKQLVCGSGILFDDEEGNRANWNCGSAYEPDRIFEILKEILT